MPTLIITRGLPGCGKTTRAVTWVAEDPVGRARVNRDDLRSMAHDGAWIGRDAGTPGTERAITGARDAAITAMLSASVDVVCDDTNLPARVVRDLMALAGRCGAQVEVWDMTDVDVDVCVERDATRAGSAQVGAAVIRGLHNRHIAGRACPLPVPEPKPGQEPPAPYVPPEGKPTAWIVDVDGTLAHMSGRSPFDWARVGEDTANPAVLDFVNTVAHRRTVIVMSGRDGSCRDATEEWLRDNFVAFDLLLMRAEGDMRDDTIVKRELFDQHIRDRFQVVGVLDDRNKVVAMWRAMGIPCFQVAEGDF
jgi:predicted kinase